MEKYTIVGICALSALVGIGLGYLAFGPVRGLVMAYDDAVVAYEANIDFALPEVVVLPPGDNEYFLMEDTVAVIAQDDVFAVEEYSHRYLVTASDDGYIVVYNVYPGDKSGGTVREVTTTTIDSLAPEEQALLLGGIRIYTEEALVRILEDYGS